MSATINTENSVSSASGEAHNKQTSDIDTGKLTSKFNWLVFKARAAIFWERSWPRLVPALCVGGAFLSASWVGLWHVLPVEAKVAGVVAFAAAAVVAPMLVKTGSLLVSKTDALKRLDKNTQSGRRPAQTLNDKLESEEQGSEAVWKLHLKSIWDEWGDKFRAGRPRPNMAKRDPYKLRFIVPACVLLTAATAGDQHYERVAEAFNWQAPVAAPVPLDVKAWVTPPEQIDVLPVYLRAGDGADTGQKEAIKVHERSVLTLTVSGGLTDVMVNGVAVPQEQIKIIKAPSEDGDSSSASTQYEIPLSQGELEIRVANGPVWKFAVTDDHDPSVGILAVDRSPREGFENTLRVRCDAEDDFGITGGRIVMTPPSGTANPQAQPLDAAQIPAITLPRHKLCARR